jgi:hypothetical protein
VGIDLLIDDPLLARVVQAEVARLGPGREVIDMVVQAIVELMQRIGPGQVAIPRSEADDPMSQFFEPGGQGGSQKTRRAGD